jgi:hypothetical protein
MQEVGQRMEQLPRDAEYAEKNNATECAQGTQRNNSRKRTSILQAPTPRMRKYANFFEGGMKVLKEDFVAQEWLNRYESQNGYMESTLQSVDDEWPDCTVEMESGGFCGIEVTELVDEVCIQLNQEGKNVYRHWTIQEVISAFDSRLKAKNRMMHGGKYQKLIVLNFTDEFEITFSAFHEVIERHQFTGLSNIDEAYLLYSYDPRYQKYPVSVLNLAK